MARVVKGAGAGTWMELAARLPSLLAELVSTGKRQICQRQVVEQKQINYPDSVDRKMWKMKMSGNPHRLVFYQLSTL